jgi:hypothetical protein
MKVKCVKTNCEKDQKLGMMQIFIGKDGSIRFARIRHYIGVEAGKPKFSYCKQSVAYAEAEVKRLGQKDLCESLSSKAIAVGEKANIDQNNVRADHNGQIEISSNSRNESGRSLAWFSSTLETSPLTLFCTAFPLFSAVLKYLRILLFSDYAQYSSLIYEKEPEATRLLWDLPESVYQNQFVSLTLYRKKNNLEGRWACTP